MVIFFYDNTNCTKAVYSIPGEKWLTAENYLMVPYDEKKKKIGVIITTLILTTIIISAYYFIIYEPYQEELTLAKTTKLNELHDLYSGALTASPNAFSLENKIKQAFDLDDTQIEILAKFANDLGKSITTPYM